MITVTSRHRREVIDIGGLIEDELTKDAQWVLLTCLHTTAGLTTADLDPGTDLDLLDFLEGIVPDVKWRHPHNPAHAPSHFLASVIGPSLMLPVRASKLVLGTWQRPVMIEFEGPRERHVEIISG
jgi:secondary thiamine-phosphate synthase enzyme